MRHLFWIICGVVLVAIIAAWLLLVPTAEARESKSRLDRQSKDLKDLGERALRGDPDGLFDAENAADTQRLANDYLITDSWTRVLQPHVEKYEKQLADIREKLVGRGAWLHQPVSVNKGQLEWYSAYIATSEKLINRLRETGCIKAAATEERNANGESPSEVRLSVGLYTKSGSFPEPSKHAELTARLRAMELVAERLIDARVAVADNPVVRATGPMADRSTSCAVITKVEWVNDSAEGGTGLRQLSTAVSGQVLVRAIGLRLTLEGSLSAVLAASATLERNAQTDRPLIALTSATLTRRESSLVGERYDVADDTVRLEAALDIIEFAEAGGGSTGTPGGN